MPVQTLTAVAELVSPTGSTVTSLGPVELSWTQDEASSPMFICRAVVAMPTAAQFAMLKPGAGYFLRVGGYEPSIAVNTYLFKVADRTRTALGLVELQCASAELDLQTYQPSAVDRSNWARQGSVTSIITAVLNTVYGSGKWARYTYNAAFGQDVGTPTFPTFSAVTNLHPNPAVASLAGFSAYSSAGTTGATLAQSTGTAQGNAARALATQSGLSYVDVRYAYTSSAGIQVQPGRKYSALVWARSDNAATSGQLYLQYTDANNVVIGSRGVTFAFNGFTYVRARVTDTVGAPLGAVGVQLILRRLNPATNGYVDGANWLVAEGDGTDTDGVTALPGFNGDTVDGLNGYNYDWQGTAGSSASTRTPIIARDPDTLTWSPGQSAWDFLQPILQASGIRLWSDGYDSGWSAGIVNARIFYATDAFGFTDTGRRVLQGFNLLDVSQIDSWSAEFADGTPMFADQVILHYTWNDALNQPREAFDVYPATGKKPYTKELEDTPFAGTGRAQGIWKRISARATMLQGTTWFDRGLVPGKQLTVSADAVGGSVVGYLEAVTFDPFRGTTEFRTKQTIAYTNLSWSSATGSWASQTGSWADES